MSQTGLVAFGLDTSSTVAQIGALLTWQVIGVATAGFAMTLASLEARRGELSLRAPGGSFTQTPRMAVAFLFMGFASVGLPLTLGFVAEDLLVQGSVEEFPILAFALIIATALNGVSVMRAFFMLFSGSAKHIGERDLTMREAAALTVVMATLLVTGLLPAGTVRGLERVTSERGHTVGGDAALVPTGFTALSSSDDASLACWLVEAPVNISTLSGQAGHYRITPYFDLNRATHGSDVGTAVDAAWALGYPMEMHVVNRATPESPEESPRYLVVSVLFRNGNEDERLGAILDGISEGRPLGFTRDGGVLEKLFSSDAPRHYYHYRRSLAVPTNEEIVDVLVLSEPRAASQAHMAAVGAPAFEQKVAPRVFQGVELVE